jgi:hypothetical protein
MTAVQAAFPSLPSGTLRFWGVWFGRPYDNIHRIVSCSAYDDVLTLLFNEAETLTVRAPRRATVDAQVFRIRSADEVRWEWYSYGLPQTPENRHHLHLIRAGRRVRIESNWPFEESLPDSAACAVEIL